MNEHTHTHIYIYMKITDTYKIDYNKTITQINKDALKFANKLHIEDRLGKLTWKMLTSYLKTINQIWKNYNLG